MTTALTSQQVLSDDELQVVAARIGVGDFPDSARRATTPPHR